MDGDRGLAGQLAAGQHSPPFWFGGNLGHNLEVAWRDANVGKALFNTVFVAGTISLGTVVFATLAGFAFAKLRFRGGTSCWWW